MSAQRSRAASEPDQPVFAWTKAAEILLFNLRGLRFQRRSTDRVELVLRGQADGRPAQRVSCSATIDPALDTCFSIEPQAGDKSTEVDLGSRLDSAYVVTTPTPERVARLIDKRVRAELLATHDRRWRVEIDASSVCVVGERVTSFDEIKQIVDTADRLGMLALHARRRW